MKTPLIAAISLAVLLAACGDTVSTTLPPGTIANTGVTGIALSGPHCPVETDPPDPACADRPVAGAEVIVTDGSGAEVARARTGEDGRFAISLPPGAYTVTPQPVEGLLGTAPAVDVVVGDVPVDLTLSYDTGIR